MFKKVMLTLAIIAMAAIASASTLTTTGLTVQGTADYNTAGDRLGLVNDGDFESGACEIVWACYADNTCLDRILDPLAVWGYAAYDGMFCAWVGGYCGGVASNNGLCQDLFIDGGTLNWFWMGYVSYESGNGNYMNVIVDGVVVYQLDMGLEHHTYGIWQNTEGTIGGADVTTFCGGTHNVCFDFAVGTNPDALGANMLIDYVTLDGTCGTANADVNFSSVKALY
jgi:hypothetical protein